MESLWREGATPAFAWQTAALLLCALVAFGVSRFLKSYIGAQTGARRLAAGSLNRAVFPMLTLGLVLAVRGLFFQERSAPLVNLAVPLLLSMALIRVALYVLRHIFPPSPLLRAAETMVAWFVWVGVALHIAGLLQPILTFFDELSFTTGKQRISVLLVLQAALSIAVTLIIALWLARLFETRVMASQNLDISLRVVLGKFMRALLLVLAVLVTLPAVGIDITALSVFGGALGVGLGLGLQKIASNYVSGFIILLDRSVRIGDLVTVDGHYGVVSTQQARYTVLQAMDGTELIIPNEVFIGNTVANHSYSNRRVLVKMAVQISYDSPLQQALDILIAAALGQKRVLSQPDGPLAVVKGFGESGIDLELFFWINDAENGQGILRSDIYRQIWTEFQLKGIEIPYPQREIRMVPAAAPAMPP